MRTESIPAYSGFRTGRVGQAYNEAAFRHFLDVERRRAGRSSRSILLILVMVRQSPGRNLTLSNLVAAAIFHALGACVRDVDFVGWYREGQVAGAVLVQGDKVFGELPHRFAERVVRAVEERLAAADSRNLRVRMVPVR